MAEGCAFCDCLHLFPSSSVFHPCSSVAKVFLPSLARRAATPSSALIDVRVRPQVAQDLLPLLLVHHQIDAALVVPRLDLPLGAPEQPQVAAPPRLARGPRAALLQALVPLLPQGLEQLVVQRHEELRRPRIALPARA